MRISYFLCRVVGDEGTTFSLLSILPLANKVMRRTNEKIEKMKRHDAPTV